MTLPAGSDPTTETDRTLLAGAASAQLPRVAPTHKPGASEHPVGRTEALPAHPEEPSGAARRQPRAGS
ncbi:MAG TPA: hypothetical protein VF834_00810 [Streptosporangiaceae bacterium]